MSAPVPPEGSSTSDAAPVASPAAVFTSRPVLAVAVALGLALLLEAAPGLERWRLVARVVPSAEPAKPLAPAVSSVGEAKLGSDAGPAPIAATDEVRVVRRGSPVGAAPAVSAPSLDGRAPKVGIVDPNDRGLAGFYAALARTERKGPDAITRVVHFGDSVVTSDLVSGTLRRRFQADFGDAGHGFLLTAAAWPAYSHWDAWRWSSEGFVASRIVGPRAADGWYGLGCVTFKGVAGTRARFGTSRNTDLGRRVSRFELHYMAEPGGGVLGAAIDGGAEVELRTDAAVKEVRRHELRAPDGEHWLELRTKSGSTRTFGVVLEREQPGVVWDAIGVQGARVRFLDEQDDAHWSSELKARRPNLLVYHFGANESGDGFAYPMADYRRTFEAVLRQGQAAVPDAGCLVIGVMDRAEKRNGQLRTMPVIPALVAEQRAAAEAVGCAYFDTFAAMGGAGSMGVWVEIGLGQADLTHPSGSGAVLLGNWLHFELVRGYRRWLSARPR